MSVPIWAWYDLLYHTRVLKRKGIPFLIRLYCLVMCHFFAVNVAY
jgi:hypothetical protein